MALKILIVGAGVAGPALAVLLQRSNPAHNITIIERFPSLRLGGQQLDFKLGGIPILQKMGLLETYKSRRVLEAGVAMVDAQGKQLATFGVNNGKSRGMRVTTDLELMRGDIVEVLHDKGFADRKDIDRLGKVKGGSLNYEYGKSVAELTQDESGVDVVFSDGQKGRYDLVVAADGQGSRTRRLAFGKEVSDESVKSTGTNVAYFNIPKVEGEGDIAKVYLATKQRGVMLRTGDRPNTQVYLYTVSDMSRTYNQPVQQQKEAWGEAFKDAGWECERFIKDMKNCEDFYANEIVQIKMPTLISGRIALLGDAGYCPAVVTGMGTSSSLIGAWVLAGELLKSGSDVPGALKAYDAAMRDPIADFQHLSGSFKFPSSRLAVWVVRNLIWAAGALNVERMMGWFSSDSESTTEKEIEKSWNTLPKYPDLEAKL